MFTLFFRSKKSEPEFDPVLEQANQSLAGRMERWLESEQMKKIRFTTIDSTPIYYR